MTELTCDICRDLLPLVQDGVASPDSEAAVRQHLAACPHCRALAGQSALPPADPAPRLRRLQNRLRLLAALVLMFGLYLGLSLTNGMDLFYNILLMPAIGALGYYIYRWRALYQLPLLLYVTQLVLYGLHRLWLGEALFWADLLVWSLLYSLFCLLGTAIAGLLHYALRKERTHENEN